MRERDSHFSNYRLCAAPATIFMRLALLLQHRYHAKKQVSLRRRIGKLMPLAQPVCLSTCLSLRNSRSCFISYQLFLRFYMLITCFAGYACRDCRISANAEMPPYAVRAFAAFHAPPSASIPATTASRHQLHQHKASRPDISSPLDEIIAGIS